MPGDRAHLRSETFRRERERTWRELESLVGQVERSGIGSLSSRQLGRLPSLYRATLSSLSVARTISLDRNVLEYLESLAARAFICVYGAKRHPLTAIADFFRRQFPREVRALRWLLALAATVLLLGTLTGFVLTASDPERFYSFVDPALAGGRDPSASTELLREVLYDDSESGGGLAAFSSFLFAHNARIGMLCFAIGFAAGLPVFFLLFETGLMLGAFGALYHGRGLGLDLWGWLLPHGVTEILALLLCAAAGLSIAQALVFPGEHSRLRRLEIQGRRAGAVVAGAVGLFFIAGLFEGFFRQLVTDRGVRYAAAVTMAGVWIYYFGFVSRPRRALRPGLGPSSKVSAAGTGGPTGGEARPELTGRGESLFESEATS